MTAFIWIIFLLAPATGPATVPANGTAPAPATSRATIDLSSPKQTARSMRSAVEHADAAALESCLFSDSPSQRKLNATYARLIIATKQLADAVTERFGATGDPLSLGSTADADLKAMESADVKTESDTRASMRLPGRDDPLIFHRDGSSWRADLVNPATANVDDADQQRAMLDELSISMTELAIETRANRYPTIADVKAAVQDRVHSAIAKSMRPPASQPVTQPSAKPVTAPATSSS